MLTHDFARRHFFFVHLTAMTALKYIAAIIIMTAAAMAPLYFVRFPAQAETCGSEHASAQPAARRVRIVALGDLMQHIPQVTAARASRGGYDYTRSFRHVATAYAAGRSGNRKPRDHAERGRSLYGISVLPLPRRRRRRHARHADRSGRHGKQPLLRPWAAQAYEPPPEYSTAEASATRESSATAPTCG